VDNVDLNIIRKLSCNFPASMERRPAWDVGVLIGLGISDLRVYSLDKEPFSVLTRDGLMKIPMSFALVARLPRDAVSPYNEVMNPIMYTEDDLRALTERINSTDFGYIKVLKSLSDPKRMALVSALMGGKMSVNQLATVTGESTSLTSHNLKILKDVNIVISERDGKEILYSLNDKQSINSIIDVCTFILYGNQRA
jgi:DNA-binding transcriptional ArsR family regulator